MRQIAPYAEFATPMPAAVAPSLGLLFSGGLDSSILAHYLLGRGHQVQPIYVALGLAWEQTELKSARRFLDALLHPNLTELIVLQMPVRDVYGDHWSITGRNVPDADSPDEAVYLPSRNPLLVLKARMWCERQGLGQLAIGCLSTNPFSDASEDFFAALGEVFNQAGTATVEIVRPLRSFSKRQVMELGRDCPLELTFSCIAPQDGLHCGECNKCAERRAAFQLLEIEDPTHYARTASNLAR